jgi:acyl-CoA dehydrogenase
MNFSLNDNQREWQLKARKFAKEEIRPISLRRDQISDPRETFDWDIIKKGSRLGLRTAAVAKESGGHGIDFVTQAVVIAELAKGDSAIAKTFSQSWKWAHLVADRCTNEQRERFLRPFVEDETFLLGGGITEPNAGSDNRFTSDDPKAGLRLKAQRHGDEWVLNGEKCFIAHGNVGKLFFVYTRTNPNVPVSEGTTIFAVPSGTPGFRVGKVYDKSGWRYYQNAELVFENARVPHANLVGELNAALRPHYGKGPKLIQLEYAANAVGICDAAIEMAMGRGRLPVGGIGRLNANQIVQLQLSEMHMLTEALRSFVMRVAAESDDEAEQHLAPNHFLMNFSCEAVQRVCNLNMEIHSQTGTGVISAAADKLLRDAIIWTHIGGDSTQRMAAVRHLISD